MSELVISEFKFLLIEELVCTYNMHEDEAKHAVQKSVVNKMLQKAPEYIMHQALEDEDIYEFVKDMVYGIVTNFDELTNIANNYLKDWTIDRLDLTGGAILRMAIYEIKYMDTPNIVVINEALELAKKYSDDAVRKMINACLDRIINE